MPKIVRDISGCKLSAMIFICLLLLAGQSKLTLAAPASHEGCGDAAWWAAKDGQAAKAGTVREQATSSFFVTMPDGVRLAVDLHLPCPLAENEKLPAILIQTRYGRAMDKRPPFGAFVKGRYDSAIELLAANGYAVIYADTRGSGASFGTRPHPYGKEEIDDSASLVDWIVSQKWSDGLVGTLGNSYDGGAALNLLSTLHPAIKAAMPRYAMFDCYCEALFPGGVRNNWLIDVWSRLSRALDANRPADYFGPLSALAVRGIKPVDEDRNRRLLQIAAMEHKANGDLEQVLKGVVYSDDRSLEGKGVRVSSIGLQSRLGRIRRSDASLYLQTGWYDASFLRSMIHLFINSESPAKKLTIGPWDHGGFHNISPQARDNDSFFAHDRELLRFFDHHLKGKENGIDREARVHYYTMVEECWKSSDNWPPSGARQETMYLDEKATLSKSSPGFDNAYDSYKVDFSAGTGNRTRWDSLVNLKHHLIEYPDREKEDRKLLVYDSAPLALDKEVTGHPLVEFYLSSTAEDGVIFAYLEDVAPDGKVSYVTEGLLRIIHRKLSNDKTHYLSPVPYRSFLRKDARRLVPGEICRLVFDLYPTSYLFKAGHRIRIAISGADRDHFPTIPTNEPTIRMYRDKSHASKIILPVVEMD